MMLYIKYIYILYIVVKEKIVGVILLCIENQPAGGRCAVLEIEKGIY